MHLLLDYFILLIFLYFNLYVPEEEEKSSIPMCPIWIHSSTYGDCSCRGMFLKYWNSYGWVLADSSCVFCLYFFYLFFFIRELAFNSIGFVHLEAGMRGKWNSIDSERRSLNWETKPIGLTWPNPVGWASKKFFFF